MKDKRDTSRFEAWSSKVGGDTLLAYCAGCLTSGALHSSALLDGICRVPEKERFKVGRLLRDSVGCPMPGKSHRKVVIKRRNEQ